MALPMVEVEISSPNSSSKACRCSSRVRSWLASRCSGSHSLSIAPFLGGLPGIALGWTSPVSRRLFSQRFMVGIDTRESPCDVLPGRSGIYGVQYPQSEILRIRFHARRLTQMDPYLRVPLSEPLHPNFVEFLFHAL